jgi:hypothetical protein
MKKNTGLLYFLYGLLAVSFSNSTALAQDEQESAPLSFSPVETYTCNYNEGKGAADLASAVAFWNDTMDGVDVTDYFALTITPHFFGSENGTFDVGWMGVWPTGEAMGSGFDIWFSEGGEAAARIFEVLTCDSHSNYASMNIKPPPAGGPPQNPVVTFSDCEIDDDTTFEQVIAGLKSWTEYQTEQGFENGSWMFFPVYGGGGDSPDFKLVQSYANHTALGKAYDLYGNGGGYLKYGELLGDLLDCDTSRVYNGNVVRRNTTEE